MLTGGIAALANLVARFILNFYISFEIAVIFAYFIGVLVAYFLTRIYVFIPKKGASSNEFFRFVQVNILSAIIVWSVSVFLQNIFFPYISYSLYSKEISHLIGVLSPILFSFFAHKFYTFK
ncbi:GtrA family protein [SAR86 cluster bacterium]|nr:GtrA family protein [SAR86 cluster bacterium]